MYSIPSMFLPSWNQINPKVKIGNEQYIVLRFKKLRSILQQHKSLFLAQKQDIKKYRREDVATYKKIEVKLQNTKEESIRADHTVTELQNKLKFLEYECFWKGIHRKHIREDLKDLKKRHLTCFDTFRNALLDFDETTQSSKVKRISPLKRLKAFFGVGSAKLQRIKRDAQTKEVLADVFGDLNDAVQRVNDFNIGQYGTYPLSP